MADYKSQLPPEVLAQLTSVANSHYTDPNSGYTYYGSWSPGYADEGGVWNDPTFTGQIYGESGDTFGKEGVLPTGTKVDMPMYDPKTGALSQTATGYYGGVPDGLSDKIGAGLFAAIAAAGLGNAAGLFGGGGAGAAGSADALTGAGSLSDLDLMYAGGLDGGATLGGGASLAGAGAGDALAGAGSLGDLDLMYGGGADLLPGASGEAGSTLGGGGSFAGAGMDATLNSGVVGPDFTHGYTDTGTAGGTASDPYAGSGAVMGANGGITSGATAGLTDLTKGLSLSDITKLITAAVSAGHGSSGSPASTGYQSHEIDPGYTLVTPGWRTDRPLYVPGQDAIPEGWYGAGHTSG